MAFITSFNKFMLPDLMNEVANFLIVGWEIDPALSCTVGRAFTLIGIRRNENNNALKKKIHTPLLLHMHLSEVDLGVKYVESSHEGTCTWSSCCILRYYILKMLLYMHLFYQDGTSKKSIIAAKSVAPYQVGEETLIASRYNFSCSYGN